LNTDTPDREASRHEDAERLDRAMRQLPEDQRQAIDLHFWQRAHWDEIGRALHRSPDAARMVVNRAVLRLKQELGK
jgi:RNA polymerase sigma-70 factor (ECF subfamily)